MDRRSAAGRSPGRVAVDDRDARTVRVIGWLRCRPVYGVLDLPETLLVDAGQVVYFVPQLPPLLRPPVRPPAMCAVVALGAQGPQYSPARLRVGRRRPPVVTPVRGDVPRRM